MPKYFNTAGPCRPELHYMLPPEQRLGNLDRLIERQEYFVLHAPRQTGKTTTVQALCERLREEGRYAALYVNVENAQVAGGDVGRGMEFILEALKTAASQQLPTDLRLRAFRRIRSVTTASSGGLVRAMSSAYCSVY